nr:MAG: RNA-dependent RNA polymerase [Wufeng shrew picorna-like virus 31]
MENFKEDFKVIHKSLGEKNRKVTHKSKKDQGFLCKGLDSIVKAYGIVPCSKRLVEKPVFVPHSNFTNPKYRHGRYIFGPAFLSTTFISDIDDRDLREADLLLFNKWVTSTNKFGSPRWMPQRYDQTAQNIKKCWEKHTKKPFLECVSTFKNLCLNKKNKLPSLVSLYKSMCKLIEVSVKWKTSVDHDLKMEYKKIDTEKYLKKKKLQKDKICGEDGSVLNVTYFTRADEMLFFDDPSLIITLASKDKNSAIDILIRYLLNGGVFTDSQIESFWKKFVCESNIPDYTTKWVRTLNAFKNVSDRKKLQIHIDDACRLIGKRLSNSYKKSVNYCPIGYHVQLKPYMVAQALVDVRVVPDMKPLVDLVASALPQFGISIRNKIIRLICCFFECLSDSSYVSKMRSVISCVIDYIDVPGVSGLVASVVSLFSKKEELVAQAFDIGLKNIKSLISLIMFCLGFTEVDRVVHDISRLKVLAAGLTSIRSIGLGIEYLCKVFKYVKDLLSAYWYGNPLFNVISWNEMVDKWSARVYEIHSDDGIHKCNIDRVVANEVRDLKITGDEYSRQVMRMGLTQTQVSSFHSARALLFKMFEPAVRLLHSDKLRVSPLVVHIFGESGVGKSTALPFFVKDLMNVMEFPFDVAVDMYYRNPSQDHWDGYCDQPVCVLDDFLQSEDSMDKIVAAVDLLRTKNMSAFPLKMADLTQKAATKFCSSLVMLTSNGDIENSLSGIVRSPEAIKRRRDVVAEMVLSRPYDTRPGDYHANATNIFDYESINFIVRDRLTSEEICVYNYPDFIYYCCGKWRELLNLEGNLVKILPTWDFRVREGMVAQVGIPNFIKDRFMSVKDVLISPIKKVSETIQENHEIIMKVLAGSLVVFGMWGIISAFMGETISEMQSSGDHKTVKKKGKIRTNAHSRRAKYLTSHVLESQASVDLSEDQRRKFVRNNLLYVRKANSKSGVHAIMLKNTSGVLPSHFVSILESDDELVFKGSNYEKTFAVSDIVFNMDEEQDVAFFNLPLSSDKFKDVTNYFIRDSELDSCLSSVALLLKNKSGESSIVVNDVEREELCYRLPETDERYKVLGFRYTGVTENGDCGSPLWSLNRKVQGKVLGFHICGSGYSGGSTILTQEHINEVLEDLSDMKAQGIFPVRKLHFLEVPYSSGKTELSRTRMEHMIPLTKPAHLRDMGDGDPGLLQLMKYNTDLPDIDYENLEYCVCNLTTLYSDVIKCEDPLTEEENILGIEGEDYINKMEMSTSPGYPYILNRKQKGKKDFIIDNKLRSDVMENVVNLEIEWASGRQGQWYYVDVLKDERREIEKVNQNKTRIFNTCPLHVNYLVRKYTLKACSIIMMNHNIKPIKVGINPHGPEWGVLYRYMNNLSGDVISGDFSAYDKTLPFEFVQSACKFIKLFIRSKYHDIFDGMVGDIFQGRHIYKDTVYYVDSGIPSGIPLTTIVNSIANYLLVNYTYNAWSYKLYGFMDNYLFLKHLKVCVYGDDNLIVKVDPTCEFNFEIMRDYMETVNMKYERNEKSGDNQIRFLKRNFFKHYGVVHAQLPITIIYEMSLWKRCGELLEEREYILQVLHQSFGEFSHYPKSEYNEYCSVLVKEFNKKYPHTFHPPLNHPTLEYFYKDRELI